MCHFDFAAQLCYSSFTLCCRCNVECLQCACTPISRLNPSCFRDASDAESKLYLLLGCLPGFKKACNVVYRRCKYSLLCICNILNPCGRWLSFYYKLIRRASGRKENKRLGSICIIIGRFSLKLCTFILLKFPKLTPPRPSSCP